MSVYMGEDFSDLDAIISEAEERRVIKSDIAGKRRKLAKGSLSDDERRRLSAEVNTWEMQNTWQSSANVALFHHQLCKSCGSTHRFFMGWMTEQLHRTDRNARRLVAGKSPEPFPERIEQHDQGAVEMCDNCAEACLIINQYVKD